jgi:hypothetical protein
MANRMCISLFRSKSMMYERNGVRVGMCHLSDHKRPVLAVGNEQGLIIVASFSSERTANQYEEYMSEFLDGLVKEIKDKEQES